MLRISYLKKKKLSELLRTMKTLSGLDDIAQARFHSFKGSEFEVNQRIVSTFVVETLVPLIGFGTFPLNEQMLMVGTVLYFRPTHVFEWGTHVGVSARIFHETTRAFKLAAEIHSIDLPDDVPHVEHPHGHRGELVRDCRNVTLHQGDGLGVSLDLYGKCAKSGVPCRPLFFIDGDHAYHSVEREIKGVLKTVENPVMLLHDTFYQTDESGYNTGPARAIKDTVRPPLAIVSTSIGLPGMTLVYDARAKRPQP